MTLADIMNADLATIGRMLRDAFEWWTGELAMMLPKGWRRRGKRGFVVELEPVAPAYYLDDRRLTALPSDTPVTISLPANQALVREVLLPRLPPRDTRRLIALDLDRLTPYDPSKAVWDYIPVDGPASPDRQRVRLAVVLREDAVRAIGTTASLGFRPTGIAVSAGAGRTEFDFLPQLRDLIGERQRWTDPRYWWGAAAALALMNVMLAVVLDIRDLAAVRDVVAAQDSGVQLAQRLQSRARAENARRLADDARAAGQNPLPVLAAATAAISHAGWVQKLTWDGHTLRLTGSAADGVDVEGGLRRSPAFASVRAGPSDLQTEDSRSAPFDLIADARIPGRRR